MLPSDLPAVVEACLPVFARLAVEVAVVVPLREQSVGPPLLIRGGTPWQVSITPRDVFREALRWRAETVVLAHNHLAPSGPSEADHAVTRRLVACGAMLGVPLAAHLVVEPTRWFDLVSPQAVDLAGAGSVGGIGHPALS